MKSLDYYLKKASEEKWALPQFNFSNLETLKAIIEVAESLKSPVIVGTSEGESSFLGLDLALYLVKFFRDKKQTPIFLNLDHGKSFEYCKKAIDIGYDTCSFDGSSLPFKKNLETAKKVVEYAKSRGVSIEGEIEEIGSSEITDVSRALVFCKETGIARLAVNIGSRHALKSRKIDFDRLKDLKDNLPEIPLVLHGASGVSEIDLRKAIKYGIAKVNINTALRKAFNETLKKVLKKDENDSVPYKYMAKVITSLKKVIERKIKVVGSVGKI